MKRAICDERILLALVHGGFLRSGPFRDIDLAIFMGYSVPHEEEIEFCEELSLKLTDEVGIYVDVRMLDYSPSWFRVSSLSRCVIIVEKDPLVKISLLRAATQEMDDLREKMLRIKLLPKR